MCIWICLKILISRAHIGHDVVLPGHTRMSQMTDVDVVFHSSRGPTSAMQFPIGTQGTGIDSNVETLEGNVCKGPLET
ncbi:hypothetical protein B0H12DRAFT_1131150, partial [Mycena haematopus]